LNFEGVHIHQTRAGVTHHAYDHALTQRHDDNHRIL